MPDNDTSDGIRQRPTADVPEPEAISTQPPTDFPKEIVGLTFHVNYKNVGHSTALNIEMVPELYLEKMHDNVQVSVQAEEERFCAVAPKGPHADWLEKGTLFPDEVFFCAVFSCAQSLSADKAD